MAEEEQKQEAPKQEAKASPAKGKKMDTIAQGKSRTSKRGILTHGDEVSPACFNGGKETFDRLKKQGVIVSIEVPAK